METVLFDLHTLKKLYGLLQKLDETPRALLKKLLDDATSRALLKQANALTTASDSVIPFSLGSASPRKMDQATSPSSSFLNNKEVEMEQILSDMQVLTRLYMLLHKGPTDENLDEASKTLLMKILEDATQEAIRRQAKMLSGSQVSGRGVATPERSSSSNTVATIQSRIRPSNSLQMERSQRRSAEKGRTSLKSDVSSANMYNSSVSSGSISSSNAASLSSSTSPTASPPVMAPRGIAPTVYAPKLSRSMRRRRRQEILEKRVGRLWMPKDKIAMVIHHRHDHHHHHHLGGAKDAGPTSRSVVHSAGHLNLPWQYLMSIFHHAKGKAKNITSRTVAAVPKKRRGSGGGGNMHALFDTVWRHLKGKRRAPTGVKLKRKASRVWAKKMHWWPRLNRRRNMAGVTVGSRP